VAPAALGWIADWASLAFNQVVDQSNEQAQLLYTIGLHKGG
jgi:hypothetical protein